MLALLLRHGRPYDELLKQRGVDLAASGAAPVFGSVPRPVEFSAERARGYNCFRRCVFVVHSDDDLGAIALGLLRHMDDSRLRRTRPQGSLSLLSIHQETLMIFAAFVHENPRFVPRLAASEEVGLLVLLSRLLLTLSDNERFVAMLVDMLAAGGGAGGRGAEFAAPDLGDAPGTTMIEVVLSLCVYALARAGTGGAVVAPALAAVARNLCPFLTRGMRRQTAESLLDALEVYLVGGGSDGGLVEEEGGDGGATAANPSSWAVASLLLEGLAAAAVFHHEGGVGKGGGSADVGAVLVRVSCAVLTMGDLRARGAEDGNGAYAQRGAAAVGGAAGYLTSSTPPDTTAAAAAAAPGRSNSRASRGTGVSGVSLVGEDGRRLPPPPGTPGPPPGGGVVPPEATASGRAGVGGGGVGAGREKEGGGGGVEVLTRVAAVEEPWQSIYLWSQLFVKTTADLRLFDSREVRLFEIIEGETGDGNQRHGNGDDDMGTEVDEEFYQESFFPGEGGDGDSPSPPRSEPARGGSVFGGRRSSGGSGSDGGARSSPTAAVAGVPEDNHGDDSFV
ncbi:expressed unknown protein [Ectocarpus siliculosus]|uniref:Uncharacterized protein n=1 Tax=Ectocarpus siliculosus TaxID=2880 RepID=D8LIC0_ECTSI|nr:expressed unknown protein [Ectocarpus siliculosus]|eukprot:CBN79423.1 expressed unknown protein [Ectocarpus siliculosus]